MPDQRAEAAGAAEAPTAVGATAAPSPTEIGTAGKPPYGVEEAPMVERDWPDERDPGAGRWLLAGLLCLLISVAVAGIAYGVGKKLPATYQSSGLIRIALASQNGISDPVVTAANDTATQYAQLASSQPIQRLAAQQLRVPVNSLDGKISGSTLGAQNLVQVTATASSPGTAAARADAASAALERYITRLNTQESAQYVGGVQRSLGQINQEISTITDRLARETAGQASTDTVLLDSLNAQRIQLLGQVARDAASNQPTLQVVNRSSSASEVSPQSKLYAVVAFVVALIITGRVAFALVRRRRTRT
jgi:capsular polysaccharide biosynthesis protein